MALELQLPPGKTTTVQLFARVVGSDVPGTAGQTISGVPDGTNPTIYRYDLNANATGDCWGQLSGVSNPNGLPFPIRDSVAFIGFSWSQVDAVAPAIPEAPPQIVEGLCNVMVAATLNGVAVPGAMVHCHLEEKNNTISGFLASRAIETGVTGSIGTCVLTLIRFDQFTRGGIYRLKVYDADGKPLQDRRVKVPSVSECNADELVDVT